jgi:hypothetical protein
MTYAELPEPVPSTKLPNGVTLEAKQPVLYCRSCHEAHSANPGDYWNIDSQTEITCADCEEPLTLAWPLNTFVAYDGLELVYRAIDAGWNGGDN